MQQEVWSQIYDSKFLRQQDEDTKGCEYIAILYIN